MTDSMTDERKLRLFAMDVVRLMAEDALAPSVVRDLAVRWGLIESSIKDGQPWLTFTPLLLGDELTRNVN